MPLFEVFAQSGDSYYVFAISRKDALEIAAKEKRVPVDYFCRVVLVDMTGDDDSLNTDGREFTDYPPENGVAENG